MSAMRRGYGEDRFYSAAKARRSHQNHHHHQRSLRRSSAATGFPDATAAAAAAPGQEKPAAAVLDSPAWSEEDMPSAPSPSTPLCNLDRFLRSTAPSVPAQYLSKMRMRGWRTCDAESTPYFALGDLWESFKEWSAYGAGVPLVLDGCDDGAMQYYVPYLSGIQLYGESMRPPTSFRRIGEASDGDCYQDLSSEGSSDYEHEKGLKNTGQRSPNLVTSVSSLRMDGLSSMEKNVALQDGFSSDDSDQGNHQGHILFEYLEMDPPYVREPLADKACCIFISALAWRFTGLKTLKSCDLFPSSWISIAWYPIYRIPAGPTLQDLDACFLTFHCLSTQQVTYPQSVGVPMLSLLPLGLACHKFKGTTWTPNGDNRLSASSLQQAADCWLRHLDVDHPDYRFIDSGIETYPLGSGLWNKVEIQKDGVVTRELV
uniref:DUF789 domain-containing protein n=1 Tax=Ananas comosus var. bracteatus TaxID=296719 RepID=A0A6V7QHI5_ANACO|nr:unnamed protein product [Ananas comosus var. bracteatus]